MALVHLHDPQAAEHLAREQSRTTHGALKCLDACALLTQVLREAILGRPDPLRDREIGGRTGIKAIAEGSWRHNSRRQIRSSGYVVHSLEAALWAVGTTTTFEKALVQAVKLGEDADTVGAVTGQIAGALYGFSAIPQRWIEPLAWREQIIKAADDLLRVDA